MAEDDPDTESSTGQLFTLTRDKLLLIVILLVGIAGSGIVRRYLGELGYTVLGELVFVLGYGGMVFTLWYGWLRPMDISGPD